MVRMSLVLLAATLWSGQVAAAGGFESGNSLLTFCTSAQETHREYCNGYVGGVADALLSDSLAVQSRACLPKDATLAQVTDAAVKWLQQNPQHRHYTAVSLIARALSDAFPCK
jgi:hypothetical protein